jgi:predicted AAA+ superfamily ATPase
VLEEFGKKFFKNYHYCNFERRRDLHEAFTNNLEPKDIINSLSFKLGKQIKIKEDLLIFDEIQACPEALTSLKYFTEAMPDLHLCAAGSLLGLQLGSSAFPVGKVEYLHMYPMDFEEFLLGIGDKMSFEFLQNYDVKTSSKFLNSIHQQLWNKLKLYLVTGGLPEVINEFKSNQKELFTACNLAREKQKEIFESYLDDIVKHAGKVNAMHIERIWQSIPKQLSQTQDSSSKKFRFKDLVPGLHSYNQLVNAFDWLIKANLAIKIPILDSISFPAKSQIEENTFKFFMFDIGFLGMMIDLDPQTILNYGFGTYQGFFLENFVAQELFALDKSNERIYSWIQKTAEIEFLYDFGAKSGLVPIEVKSGWVSKSKSLKSYIDRYKPKTKILLSANYIDVTQDEGFYKIPLFMISSVFKTLN